jgi:hypothetical protein
MFWGLSVPFFIDSAKLGCFVETTKYFRIFFLNIFMIIVKDPVLPNILWFNILKKGYTKEL